MKYAISTMAYLISQRSLIRMLVVRIPSILMHTAMPHLLLIVTANLFLILLHTTIMGHLEYYVRQVGEYSIH